MSSKDSKENDFNKFSGSLEDLLGSYDHLHHIKKLDTAENIQRRFIVPGLLTLDMIVEFWAGKQAEEVEYFRMSDIVSLDINCQQLLHIDYRCEAFKDLKTISACENQLELSYFAVFPNIQVLDLSFNEAEKVNGIDLGFKHLTNLTLSYNRYKGSIMNELGKLENLRFLDLSNNSMTDFFL
jgi:Leucine-rich repeat (LRR) protein